MAPATSDKALVERVLSKDRAAFEEFFNAYFGRLVRFCTARMGDVPGVEDVVQETMIKAVKNLHSYRGEALLFTWLCQICRNEMSDWHARHGKRERLNVSIDDDPAVLASLESLGLVLQDDLANRIALADIVGMALDYLPDTYGRALELKYVEGLSVKEIAVELGLGRLATQSLLARARKAFRTSFQDLQQGLSAP